MSASTASSANSNILHTTTHTTDHLTQQIRNHFSPISLHFQSSECLHIKSYLKNHEMVHFFVDGASFDDVEQFVKYLEENRARFHDRVLVLWNLASLFHEKGSKRRLYSEVLKTLLEITQALVLPLQTKSEEKLFENFFIPYNMYFTWVERENLIMRVISYQQRDYNSKRISKRKYLRFPETKAQKLHWLEEYAEVDTIKNSTVQNSLKKSPSSTDKAIQEERRQQKQDSLQQVQMESTFNLETSAKEAQQRDSVVLPHQRIGQQKTISKVRNRGGIIQIENELSDEDSDFDTDDDEPDDDEEL